MITIALVSALRALHPAAANAGAILYSLSADYSGLEGLGAGSTLTWSFEAPSIISGYTDVTTILNGFYLRGRYEVQLENEPEGSEPPERGMGSIYGRLAPNPMGKRHPGEWDAFDVTLVGRGDYFA